MIQKSTYYKLIDREGIIVNEGSSKQMSRLAKKSGYNLRVFVCNGSIGDYKEFAKNSFIQMDNLLKSQNKDSFLEFADNINSDQDKKNFINSL